MLGIIVCPIRVQLVLLDDFLHRWSRYYDEPYSHNTLTTDLDSVPASAKWIFVGARNDKGRIAVGAVGKRNAVLQRTDQVTPWCAEGNRYVKLQVNSRCTGNQ